MKTSFNGFNEQVASFEADSSVAAGKAVGISANGKVQAVTSGAFCGVCKKVKDGIAAVQLAGYVKVRFHIRAAFHWAGRRCRQQPAAR